ncbi:hypothetical protein BDZ89DRAFT_1056554 [Hymenopellis radicata]|nr:hypothetical protein BDZ89DRAFT_1056554 [Hymenopellis radicata]
MSYYPSHYAQLSPRDNYLAALACAKAAEEEYLAAEAIDREERQIRRRLEELEFQKQKACHSHYPSYGAPDRLSVMRLQLQDEERQEAEVELFRRRKLQEETALAALQLDQERRERAQLELLLEQRPTNHTSARKPERYQARPSRYIHPAVAHPQHALPEANPSSSNVDLEDVLHALFGGKPSSSTRHYGAPMRPPIKAERMPAVQSVDTAAAIEQTLKAIFPDANLHFHDQPKAASTVQSAPATSCARRPEKNPGSTVPSKPAVQESASSPLPSTDTAINLQQVLKHLFGGAFRAYTPNEGQQAVPPQEKPPVSRSEIQRPTYPLTSLKEQLEARLASEETTEVKDTIQAIFNSLSDATISVPFTAEAFTSSSKGKAKAELTPSTNTESEDVAVSLARVNSIESAYRSLIDEFTFPALLDFSPSLFPACSESLIARLAYTARNAPVRVHEQSLSGLLSQLDSVESFGDEGLRAKRKEVVGLVEGALEDLEREVEGRWRAKVAKDSMAANADERTSPPEDLASAEHVESWPTTEPAPAPAIARTFAEATVSATDDPSVVEGQAALSLSISASPEQPEVVALLDPLAEEDVSSDETELSTDIESSADSFDDVESDTFRSGSTPPESSTASVTTLKPDYDGLQAIEQSKGKVSDEGSDWSEVEA